MLSFLLLLLFNVCCAGSNLRELCKIVGELYYGKLDSEGDIVTVVALPATPTALLRNYL